MSKEIKLIVGLGNPGVEYQNTRHNAGFWLLDELVWQEKTSFKDDKKFLGQVSRINIQQRDIWLLKPSTFMNRSGQSVLALAHFYKILPDEILVIHDELDLKCGIAKLKFSGGNGGHNGLKDIQNKLSTPNFWRLRIGIDHPGIKNEVVNYVLKKPLSAEQELIDQSIHKALKIIPNLCMGQDNIALQNLNTY